MKEHEEGAKEPAGRRELSEAWIELGHRLRAVEEGVRALHEPHLWRPVPTDAQGLERQRDAAERLEVLACMVGTMRMHVQIAHELTSGKGHERKDRETLKDTTRAHER